MSFSINKALVLAHRQAKRGIETTIKCEKCDENMLIGRS